MAALYLTLLVVLLGSIEDVSGVAGDLGAACLSGNTCNDNTNLVCESSLCLYKAGVTCTTDATKCVSHATCASAGAQCTCANGYSNNGGLCAGDNKFGGICTAPASGTDSCVANDPNSKCSQETGGKCGCKTNYSGSIGAMCAVTPNTYGGACTAPTGGTDSCVATDPNSKCSGTTGTCGCKTYYSGSIGATCAVTPNTYGGICTAPASGTDSCVANDANSKCSGTSGTCGCKTGYSGSIGTKCAGDNKYGGVCTAPVGGTDSCVANDANSKCSGVTGTCGCKTGFTASIGTLCSGAMGIAGSITLLVSALLIKVHLV